VLPAAPVRIVIVALVIIALQGGAAAAAGPDPGCGPQARNVILMIGDGMGPVHIEAARWAKAGCDLDAYASVSLAMDRLEYSGTVSTAAADAVVTDSAAAATALMTGVRTDKGVIGQDPSAVFGSADGVRLATIAELAAASGRATGVVSNTRLTHATPAGAYAHVNNRDNERLIASQFIDSDLDVALGGGYDLFIPWSVASPWGANGSRTDGRDLVAEARAEGYTVVTGASGLAAVPARPGTRLLGLFGPDHLHYDRERGAEEPALAEMTRQALSVLEADEDGFFLMVEGGLIDFASHYNDNQDTTDEVLAFDDAVQVALGFADRHPGTLLIVTADHECGGLTVRDVEGRTKTFFFVTTGHTAADVRIMASGPFADRVDNRRIENTRVFEIMRDAIGGAPAAPTPGVVAVPGGTGLPRDLDDDGLCEDVNGNGRADFADVVLFFNQMTWIAANEPVAAFDCNGNGRIDFADVVRLYETL
jgi:alkaline phosphatase